MRWWQYFGFFYLENSDKVAGEQSKINNARESHSQPAQVHIHVSQIEKRKEGKRVLGNGISVTLCHCPLLLVTFLCSLSDTFRNICSTKTGFHLEPCLSLTVELKQKGRKRQKEPRLARQMCHLGSRTQLSPFFLPFNSQLCSAETQGSHPMGGERTEASPTGHLSPFLANLLWYWWAPQGGFANQMEHGVAPSPAV